MHINDIPIYKRILNSTYTVDCFKIEVEGCSHYFLSHFHADHYYGLKSKFPHKIYCSPTTSNLLRLKYKVETVAIEMYKEYPLLEGDSVMFIDAFHCPGAVCMVFNLKGDFVLHTGDFRSTPEFLSQVHWKFRTVYLDNTYEGFRTFGSQKESIYRVLKIIEGYYNRTCLVPLKYTFMFCTYSVGKEKIFLSAAEFFNKPVRVTKEKMKIYDCYDEYAKERLNKEVQEILGGYGKKKGHHQQNSLFKSLPVIKKGTTFFKSAFSRIISHESLHKEDYVDSEEFVVISTMQVEKKRLHKLLLGNTSDRIIVFCGTGWKDTIKYYDWTRGDGRVVKKGIEIHYVPYSEHSSSEELLVFKEKVETERIINTVKGKNLEG